MPLKLSTPIWKIKNIPNPKNTETINKFFASYIHSNASSEHNQNNNLKVVNTKVKSYGEDPDKRWITTWNNYLNRLRLFYRWLYNQKTDINHE